MFEKRPLGDGPVPGLTTARKASRSPDIVRGGDKLRVMDANQDVTTAAMQMADLKVFAQGSCL